MTEQINDLKNKIRKHCWCIRRSYTHGLSISKNFGYSSAYMECSKNVSRGIQQPCNVWRKCVSLSREINVQTLTSKSTTGLSTVTFKTNVSSESELSPKSKDSDLSSISSSLERTSKSGYTAKSGQSSQTGQITGSAMLRSGSEAGSESLMAPTLSGSSRIKTKRFFKKSYIWINVSHNVTNKYEYMWQTHDLMLFYSMYKSVVKANSAMTMSDTNLFSLNWLVDSLLPVHVYHL